MEKPCFAKLVECYKNLEKTDGSIDTKKGAGHDSCQEFLHAVQATIHTLNITTASRQYRSSFTTNYRFLFPDDGLLYRIDVFEASIERHPVIWVNGDKFEFTVNTMSSAENLQQSFAELYSLLDVESLGQDVQRQVFDELRSALRRLDECWASFEKTYIYELIAIEAKARGLIENAVESERQLYQAEKDHAAESLHGRGSVVRPNVRQKRRQFISSVSKLNSVANNKRKGRDDLDPNIIEEALVRLHRWEGDLDERSAALMIDRDIVESFEAIRQYFRDVSKCLDRVDPNLCNNSGLVERLADWEESWEMGAKYARHASVLHSVVDVVAELQEVEQVAPQLKTMCDDCDVELFLCIPRILWLRFLEAPAMCRELFKSLLPHHFGVKEGDMSENLIALLERFEKVQHLMGKCFGPSEDRKFTPFVWELLVRRAVTGSADADDLYETFVPHAHTKAVKEAMESLMNDLEKWSMELQRHAPEDWNQCSSLLIRCLTGSTTVRIPQEFSV
jgi:hypothetical protein